ncbi:ester hydrolase C11orf54 homolog [Monomorium pharaonis]|uniref:ester hydrolase C11orf54 homolog n=1 Tax=Monomorium pharaonis TaxID=307658 RepID=UPI00063F4A1F|nr:ester hydrolase C11orf54 homolog [Monomorium pharaonis]
MQNDNIEGYLAAVNLEDKTYELEVPDLSELCSVMKESLQGHFNDLMVNVVECPNLRRHPYNFAASGLCGGQEVIEFGNYRHLYNLTKNMGSPKSWNLQNLIQKYYEGRKTDSFIIGESMLCGPPNKECIVNATYTQHTWGYTFNDKSYCTFLNEEEQIVSELVANSRSRPKTYDLYGSVFVCSGERKPVLEIVAKGSFNSNMNNMNILNLMEDALHTRYFSAKVGLSGVLLINSGMIEAAVMLRTFTQTPLTEFSTINELKTTMNYKYNVSAPVTIYNTMFNFDRILLTEEDEEEEEENKEWLWVNPMTNQILPIYSLMGGRYVRNITPYIEYKGYFTVVKKLHRVDAEVIFD